MAGDVQEATVLPIARSFDLILSEYAGYTDDKILDLTLARIRQMIRVIVERRERERQQRERFELLCAQVNAQAIGGALAGLAQSRKGANSILSNVKRTDFVKEYDKALAAQEKGPKKPKELPSTAAVLAAFGVGPGGQIGRRG